MNVASIDRRAVTLVGLVLRHRASSDRKDSHVTSVGGLATTDRDIAGLFATETGHQIRAHVKRVLEP